MMKKSLIPILNEFEKLKVYISDFSSYRRLNQLTDSIIKINASYVVKHFLKYIRDKRYLKTTVDIRITHMLLILEHYNDPICVPELITLAEDEKVSAYMEDICNTIGKFKTDLSKTFLRKNLKNKRIAYRCAISLAYFPDSSGELILLDNFKESLKQNNFFPEIFKALVYLGNKTVWLLLTNYLTMPISELERYKICLSILRINNTRVIPLLINLYKHYKDNPQINYHEVKAITLEYEDLILTKAHRESTPFSKKIKSRIKNKLKEYHSDFRVKLLLQKDLKLVRYV